MGRVRAYKAVQGQLKGSTTAVATIVCPVNTPPQVEFRNLQGRIQEETIRENADVGKLVAIVFVTDTDMGDNGRTTVRITRGNEDGLFTLDSSGDFHVLRTASKLSSNHQYRITVEAKDSGTPVRTSTASLVIRLSVSWTGNHCVRDQDPRLLPFFPGRSWFPSLTPAKCIKACNDQNYNFAGVQFGHQCFCGNDAPPEYTIVDMEECNQSCGGDSAQKCGAAWRMNVYKIGTEEEGTEETGYSGTVTRNFFPASDTSYRNLIWE